MKRFATIKDGVVERVFVATDESLPRLVAAAEEKAARLRDAIDVTDIAIGPGHLYDAEKGEFTAPPEPEEDKTPTLHEQVAALQAEVEALKAGK